MVKKEDLDKLLEINVDIEKVSKISSDGKTLSTRIPNEIIKELKIIKGQRIHWFVDIKNKKINLDIE